ncbi:MAG: hypothetical protein COY58_02295 [Gammaproteobacteria bacterium CG_4_10_14_0_8_um_filter_38_16]|nr:MAG: hypothetical protein COY58_02295 [Gammaproteobacteria bacterium CG_4_10_14_0_8_um_filter_38_16]PJA03765.1 MAG: hypothetical protein COX72_02455 [Gammaproteobacteria bacterium CG_4_10_14_0_2_um_filter_38_22]PJB10574.1 MAG: hypothetical protein CO120_04170 [Gammaproteobacteria bacterium CG_4_9_14_3_um_filter_38_9]
MQHSVDFFELAHQNFLGAVSRAQKTKRFYQLAGLSFCVQFAGDEMMHRLTPALQHLAINQRASCDLTICVWDSVSTQTPVIPLPTAHQDYALRGEILKYNNDRIYALLDIHTKVLHLYDKERNIALYYIHDARKLPWWIGGSPFLPILHWWMRTHTYQFVHAAVVGYPENGILFSGKSGTGKSTTALACMKAGMKLVSEDYCVVSDLPNVIAHSIYNSAKIEEKTLNWFPEIKTHITNINRSINEKAFIYHHQFQPEKILLHCPIKAIVILKIENSKKSWLEPIDSHSALTSLSVSTMWQLTHSGLTTLTHLKKLVSTLQCYQLHVGSNVMQAPALLETIL